MRVRGPCCTIPIPGAGGGSTGYGFVMPDQNGWSRYLHFQTAWALVLTGLVVDGALLEGYYHERGKR